MRNDVFLNISREEVLFIGHLMGDVYRAEVQIKACFAHRDEKTGIDIHLANAGGGEL